MFNLSRNGIITLTAGDDCQFPVFINANNDWEPLCYELMPFDLLYFVIEEQNQPFEAAVVRKIFTDKDVDEDGNVIITLTHNDTARLLPGTYTYEIKVLTNNNGNPKVSTIVPRRKFFLLS